MAAAGAFQEEKEVAQDKIAELEAVIERSKREHDLLRERTEGRLELLRSVMEQEEQENGSQVCGGWVGCAGVDARGDFSSRPVLKMR